MTATRFSSEAKSYRFDTIVLIGCHGSGKTTLGQNLAQVLGWPFHDEIGRRLREERLSMDQEAHAQQEQPDFDQAVWEQECHRDHTALVPRVVETWHPGNLAYMKARSPALFAHVFAQVKKWVQSQGRRVLVQPLKISMETLRRRLTEPGPCDASFFEFLHSIESSSSILAHELGLFVASPLHTDLCDVQTCVDGILTKVFA